MINTSKGRGHVFINCPFDIEYEPIFKAIIFTLLDCDFSPRCTKEFGPGVHVRLDQILDLIRQCPYAIHDLSRVELDHQGLPRFNMPFELGLFSGCKYFGRGAHKQKKAIIMSSKPYQDKKYLSDIAGQDPVYHNNNYTEAISSVRDWLAFQSTYADYLVGGHFIAERFSQFIEDMPGLYASKKLLEDNNHYRDYTLIATSWLEANPIT